MKRKLIINTEQFNRLNEAAIATDDKSVADNALSQGNNVQYTQSGKTGPEVNLTKDEYLHPSETNMGNAINNASQLNISNVSESFTLSKKDARILSKLNENDRVYSKKSFKKALFEEYADFNTRLNNRRKNK